MKRNTRRARTISCALILVLLCSPGAAFADGARYYVRAGASGASSGTDWTNAYPAPPEHLERGATYYVADGNYPSHNFNDPEKDSAVITVKKATAADHGTGTGWQDSYGAGRAVLGSVLAFTTGYYRITGNGTHTIPSDNPADYGFKIDANTSDSWGGIVRFGASSQGAAAHIDIQYVHVYNATNASDSNNGTVSVRFGGGHTRLQNCFFENSGKDGIQISSACYVLMERCYVKRLGKLLSPNHGQTVQLFYGGDDIIFRWNVWEACEGQGLVQIAAINKSTSRVRFYGNVVFVKFGRKKDTPGFNGSGGIFGCAWVKGPVDEVYVYNNTFVNIGGEYGGIAGFPMKSPKGTRYCYNNLFYNCKSTGFSGWTAYGRHASGGGDAAGGDDEQKGLPAGIFKDYTGNDFRLAAPTEAGLALTKEPWWKEKDDFFGTLDSDRDMYGTVRGAEGKWSRGAFEFAAAKTAPASKPSTRMASP